MEILRQPPDFSEDYQAQCDLLQAVKQWHGTQLHASRVIAEFISTLGPRAGLVIRHGWQTQFEACRQVERLDSGEEIQIASLLIASVDPHSKNRRRLVVKVGSVYAGLVLPYEGYSFDSATLIEEQLKSREEMRDIGLLPDLLPTCIGINKDT